METLLDLNKEYTLELDGKKYHLDYVKPRGIAGRGGSSIVYKAQEEGGFNDFYVIKEFCPHKLTLQRMANGSICIPDNKNEKKEYEKRKSRALSESKIVDKLRHNNKTKNNNPYIFPYSNPIEANNTLYTVIATESGDMLSCMMHNGFFNDKSFPNICDCILKILDALEPIHDQGYLHLDISPGNIHFSELGRHDSGLGIARLIDFNSAFRPGDDDLRDWNPTFKKGYSAHELASFETTKPLELCPATDLYSVAAIFFELLIERPPQADDGDSLDEWPQWISKSGCVAGVSNRLIKKTADLLWKGLSSWPKNRFKDVAEMRATVEELKSIAQKRKVFLSNAKVYSERQFKEWKEKNEIIYSALYGNDERIPMTVKDGDNEYNINTLFAKLESQKCRHAVLVGEGGMGKTFTCMLLGERHLNEKPVLYIPLCDYSLDRPIKKNIMRAFGVESDDDYEYLIDEEEMLILLDGFNEIKSEFAHAFFMELRDLKVGEHIQTLITSRTDMLHVETANFAKLLFVPISDKVIDVWLEKYAPDNRVLGFSHELYNILSNPMLLKIYAVNIRGQISLTHSQKSKFLDNPITAGEIIWNFLEHQIIKTKNIFEDGTENEGFGIIFFRFLLPYIAYQLESTEKSSFTLRDLKKYIGDFHSYFKTNCDYFDDLIRYEDTVINLLTAENKTGTLLEWCTESFCIIKLRQVGDAKSEAFDFIHQHFRDIFSAIFIKNQMELENKSVFTSRVLPHHVSQMLMEILQEHKNVKPSKLKEYLSIFKGEFDPQAQIGVHNCLRIIIKARSNDLSGEDLSNLDLRHVPMNGILFSNQNNGFADFEGSFISDTTLLPQGHSGYVTTAVYSSDGLRMLSASYDNTIKEWDMETGRCLCTFRGHSEVVFNAVYSPDGQRILSVSGDDTIKEWDRETGWPLCTIKGPFEFLFDAAYSSDGLRVFSVDIKTIKEWNRKNGQCLRTLEEPSDTSIDPNFVICKNAHSPDGLRVLSYLGGETIKEYDKETGQCLHTFEGHSDCILAAVYRPDGQRILSVSSDETIKEWDRETERCLRTFEGHSSYVRTAAYSPDGQRVLFIHLGTIKEWDIKNKRYLHTFKKHFGTVIGAAYSPDEFRVLLVYGDNTIKEWDRKTGQCLPALEHLKNVKDAVYNHDGQKILLIFCDNTVNEWDRKTKQCLPVFEENSQIVRSAMYNYDDQKVLLLGNTTIREWDKKTGGWRIFEGHSGTVLNAEYSPDGLRVLIGRSGVIEEWDIENKQCLCIFKEHPDTVIEAAYSPDGQRILSTSYNSAIKEWDRKTGQCLRTFIEHSYDARIGILYDICTVYSPDSQRILFLGDITREWDIETKQWLWEIPIFDGICINDCSFKDCRFSSDELKELIRAYGGKL